MDITIIDDPFVEMDTRTNALIDHISVSGIKPGSKATNSKIDIHLHSNYSDGYWTPTGLVYEAYMRDMSLISLSDHDSFNGIEEAFSAINAVSETTGKKIGFLPGIEFSTNYLYDPAEKAREIHILGYFPSESYKQFQLYLKRIKRETKEYMAEFIQNRNLRIVKMVENFNQELPSKVPKLEALRQIRDPIISEKTMKRGFRNSKAPSRLLATTGIFDVYRLYMNGQIDQIKDEVFSPDYLEALKELFNGFEAASDVVRNFFLSKQPSAYMGYIGTTESPEWAVKTIVDMGGIPVLAHPSRYIELYIELLDKLVPCGLKGVEVLSDRVREDQSIHAILDYPKKNYPRLVITIGSDCHGGSLDGAVNYTPRCQMGLKNSHGYDLSEFYNGIYDLLF